MSVRVKSVTALDDFKLDVLFKNGVRKIYDMKKFFAAFPEAFDPLMINPALFKLAEVDCGGCGVSWSPDMDIAAEDLWNGEIVEA